MTTAQKIIKYIATAFACFLIVSIISGILSALYALSGVLGLQKEDKKIKDEMSMINFENSEVVSDDVTYGDRENTIKIDGGIGNINVDFED